MVLTVTRLARSRRRRRLRLLAKRVTRNGSPSMIRIIVIALVGAITALAADKNKGTPMTKEQILRRFHDEFVVLTPGKDKFPVSFKMGSAGVAAEEPVHEVTFKDSFAIAKYEVTQELWEAIMGKNPSKWKGPR